MLALFSLFTFTPLSGRAAQFRKGNEGGGSEGRVVWCHMRFTFTSASANLVHILIDKLIFIVFPEIWIQTYFIPISFRAQVVFDKVVQLVRPPSVRSRWIAACSRSNCVVMYERTPLQSYMAPLLLPTSAVQLGCELPFPLLCLLNPRSYPQPF